VTRKYGNKLSSSVFISSLYASKICLAEIRVMAIVVVAEVFNTRVASGGIAVPYFPIYVLNRLTCVYIDEFTVQDQWNSRLPVSDIGSDQLAINPERANCGLRSKQTRRALRRG
jgi:hypothetical protein